MAAVSVNERELLQLLRDHLQQTGQVESMWSLEKSTGVQPAGLFPKEKAVRRLVSLGQWEHVRSFLLPLKDKEGYSHCQFLLHRQELLELLFSRADNLPLYETKVRKAMLRLQQSCPTKEQFVALSYLVSLSNLQADPNYKEWTPANSRLELFHVLSNFLRRHVHPQASLMGAAQTTGGSRLAQLVTRGLLYEKCEEVFKTQQQEKENESTNPMDLCQWLHQQPDSMFLAQPPHVLLEVAQQPSSTESRRDSQHKSLAHLSLDACHEWEEESILSRSVPSSLHLCQQASAEHATLAALTQPATPSPCFCPPGGVASSTPKLKNSVPLTEVRFSTHKCLPKLLVCHLHMLSLVSHVPSSEWKGLLLYSV